MQILRNDNLKILPPWIKSGHSLGPDPHMQNYLKEPSSSPSHNVMSMNRIWQAAQQQDKIVDPYSALGKAWLTVRQYLQYSCHSIAGVSDRVSLSAHRPINRSCFYSHIELNIKKRARVRDSEMCMYEYTKN